MKKLLYVITAALYLFFANIVLASSFTPSSSHYQIREYGFGAGGTASSSSTTYNLFGAAGEIESGSQSSSQYTLQSGLSFVNQANVPPAPAVTNPSSYYNKLQIVINTFGNTAADEQFAIAVSPDNFVTTKYLQTDQTINNAIVWQTNASWNGSNSYTTAIGLTPGTTYSVKVAAKQGSFTQSAFGPVAQAATVNPTISYSISIGSSYVAPNPPYQLAIGQINAGAVTTSTNKVWINLDTNANSGGTIYIYDANNGLLSSQANYNLPSVSNDLSTINEGYGAISTSTTQTSGGTMEALSPYAGTGDNVGTLTKIIHSMYDSSSLPVTGGRVSFALKAKAQNTTPGAPDYSDTLTVIATGSF